jgi:hypothetical protein
LRGAERPGRASGLSWGRGATVSFVLGLVSLATSLFALVATVAVFVAGLGYRCGAPQERSRQRSRENHSHGISPCCGVGYRKTNSGFIKNILPKWHAHHSLALISINYVWHRTLAMHRMFKCME